MRARPPGRRSYSIVSRGVLNPSGPHHFATSSGSVHTRQTSSRGASSSRSITIVRSVIAYCCCSLMVGAFLLDLPEAKRDAVEPALPDVAVLLQPLGHVAQRRSLQPGGPQLRRATARDQAGALQHLQVLRDGLDAVRERLRELVDRHLALLCEPGEDRPPRRVGERREREAELVGRHRSYSPRRFINHMVE